MKRLLVLGALACLAIVTTSDAFAMGEILHAAAGASLAAPAAFAAVAALARPRSIIQIRADANDPGTVLANLQRSFEAFKAEHTAALAKKADVVTDEKVTRIDASVAELQATLDTLATQVAAASLGSGGSGEQVSAEARQYRQHFASYFRQGDNDREVRAYNVQAAARTNSQTDGGYLVTDEMETAIGRILGVVSSMRGLATIRTIGTGAYKKMHGLGGATAGWTGETSGRPQTETPKLVELAFPAMELYAQPAATQTLLDDAVIDIGAWLGDEVSITFAEQEGSAFISGDGVLRPRGLMTGAPVADANWAWGKVGFIASGAGAGFAANNPADALIDLVYALKNGYRQNATFVTNRKTQGTLRKFKDGQGNYLWQPSAQMGQPATFLNYPIADDDNMPDVAAGAFPIAFGDIRRAYLIVDRAGVRVLRDPYSAKPYVLFYTTKRVGGGIQDFQAIKYFKIA